LLLCRYRFKVELAKEKGGRFNMNNNKSSQNIKKDIKSMASLLAFQENLIAEIKTGQYNNTDASKKNKNKRL